jgi:hypothetical protein
MYLVYIIIHIDQFLLTQLSLIKRTKEVLYIYWTFVFYGKKSVQALGYVWSEICYRHFLGMRLFSYCVYVWLIIVVSYLCWPFWCVKHVDCFVHSVRTTSY